MNMVMSTVAPQAPPRGWGLGTRLTLVRKFSVVLFLCNLLLQLSNMKILVNYFLAPLGPSLLWTCWNRNSRRTYEGSRCLGTKTRFNHLIAYRDAERDCKCDQPHWCSKDQTEYSKYRTGQGSNSKLANQVQRTKYEDFQTAEFNEQRSYHYHCVMLHFGWWTFSCGDINFTHSPIILIFGDFVQ